MKTWEILCCICFGVILTLFSWPFATFWIASELFIRNYLINSLPSITQPLFSPAIWPLAYDPFLFSTLPLATNIWVSASYTFHWTKNTVLHLIPHPTTGCSLKLSLYLYKLHLPIHDQWSTLSHINNILAKFPELLLHLTCQHSSQNPGQQVPHHRAHNGNILGASYCSLLW